MEKFDIFCTVHTNHINTQCGHNVLCLTVSYGGTYSNHCCLEGYTRNGCDAKLPPPTTPSFRRCCSVNSVSMRRAVGGERIVFKLVLEI